ncbi:MAG: rhodanese-like domain-containing protein [bacterium]|nr:rhodanese-like domain-containing protein [bacterium]
MFKRYDSYIKVLLVLCLVPGLFLSVGCKESGDNGIHVYVDITPAEAAQLIRENQGNANFVILDVRTQGEFAGGYIEGAVNIDFYAADFRDSLQGLSKSKIYLIYCRSGNRSASALAIMRELEFEHVNNMLGGITRWISEGYSVVTN